MTQILLQTSDIGLMNAVLHLLDSMIELFDIESSDSESDEEDQGVPQTASEGIQILQSVLNNSHCLPTHPLVLEGLTRLTFHVSSRLTFPICTNSHCVLFSVPSDICVLLAPPWFSPAKPSSTFP